MQHQQRQQTQLLPEGLPCICFQPVLGQEEMNLISPALGARLSLHLAYLTLALTIARVLKVSSIKPDVKKKICRGLAQWPSGYVWYDPLQRPRFRSQVQTYITHWLQQRPTYKIEEDCHRCQLRVYLPLQKKERKKEKTMFKQVPSLRLVHNKRSTATIRISRQLLTLSQCNIIWSQRDQRTFEIQHLNYNRTKPTNLLRYQLGNSGAIKRTRALEPDRHVFRFYLLCVISG